MRSCRPAVGSSASAGEVGTGIEYSHGWGSSMGVATIVTCETPNRLVRIAPVEVDQAGRTMHVSGGRRGRGLKLAQTHDSP